MESTNYKLLVAKHFYTTKLQHNYQLSRVWFTKLAKKLVQTKLETFSKR